LNITALLLTEVKERGVCFRYVSKIDHLLKLEYVGIYVNSGLNVLIGLTRFQA